MTMAGDDIDVIIDQVAERLVDVFWEAGMSAKVSGRVRKALASDPGFRASVSYFKSMRNEKMLDLLRYGEEADP